MTTENEIRELLTTTGAAKRANVSAATILHWARTGRLACLRLAGGGPRLFSPEQVDCAAAEARNRREQKRGKNGSGKAQ